MGVLAGLAGWVVVPPRFRAGEVVAGAPRAGVVFVAEPPKLRVGVVVVGEAPRLRVGVVPLAGAWVPLPGATGVTGLNYSVD